MSADIQKEFEKKAFGKPTFVPRFFEHAAKDVAKSFAYGMNIYDTTTYIEIKTVGRKDSTTRRATDEDKALFSEAYRKYTEKQKYNFLPMEAVAGFSKANQFILRDLNITTVEELAEYTGKLPLGSLKLMRDSAMYMIDCMTNYEPVSFNDDKMETIRDVSIQAQRKVLPVSECESFADGEAGDYGGGVQRLGVTLSEDGEIIELNGRAISPDQIRYEEKSVQKKEVKRPVIALY